MKRPIENAKYTNDFHLLFFRQTEYLDKCKARHENSPHKTYLWFKL